MKLKELKEQAKNKVAYILIGLPGSGKSTWIKNSVKNLDDFQIVSTDDFIENIAKQQGLTYNDIFQGTIKDATKNLQNQLKNAISNNLNIIWDQTNLNPKKRKNIIQQLPKDYYKVAVVFEIDESELNRRIKYRSQQEGKSIPDHVLKSMKDSFVYPTMDEGFDKIIKGN